MKVSVVIPSHDHWALTHNLLYSPYKLESEDLDELVLIDDHSEEAETLQGEEWWITNGMFKGRAMPFRVIRLGENLGFLKASNFGLRQAEGDIKVLLSNDVVVTSSYLPDVKAVLANDPRALVGQRLLNGNTGWNDFKGVIYPYLEGFLLAATKETWNELNYFDEKYVPYCFEDVDLSTTTVSQGRHLVQLNLPGLNHLVAQTIPYNEARNNITMAHKEVFRAKWIK
jgi:GT2 family glycosyltransferase